VYIFANSGILSIVAHQTKPGMLMVRSVACEDIARFWPKAKIIPMLEADYRYRTTLPRDEVATRIAQAVHGIDYEKVKPSVSKDRSHTYFEVWNAMMSLQDANWVT